MGIPHVQETSAVQKPNSMVTQPGKLTGRELEHGPVEIVDLP